jgi:predicted ATPase
MSYSAFDKFNKPETKRTFSYVYCGIYDAHGKLHHSRQLLSKTRQAANKIVESDRNKLWREMIGSVLDKPVMEKLRKYLFTVHSDDRPAIVPKLSSGQLVLVSTITELVAAIENESIVLIDEPEMHQHPNSVAGLLLSLTKLLKKFDSFAVIATHSPLVIQQIPAKYVRLFVRVGNATIIRPPVKECFGENLTSITQEIFQTNASPSLYQEWFKEATADMEEEELVSLFKHGLSFNALSMMESVKR